VSMAASADEGDADKNALTSSSSPGALGGRSMGMLPLSIGKQQLLIIGSCGDCCPTALLLLLLHMGFKGTPLGPCPKVIPVAMENDKSHYLYCCLYKH